MYLPLHVEMRGKKVLIVGLGKVGRRRAEKLLNAGAKVNAIDRKKLKANGVRTIQKELGPGNLPSFKGYFLVITSTGDKKLNDAVTARARKDGCMVNRADLPAKGGDVVFPAVVETDVGTFSFTTLGKNPRLSKRVKEAFEREFSGS